MTALLVMCLAGLICWAVFLFSTRPRAVVITCPRSESISLLMDGELAGEEMQQVRAHLGRCPECRTKLRDYAVVDEAVRAQAEEDRVAGGRSP